MDNIIFKKATLNDISEFIELRKNQLLEEGAVPTDDISIPLRKYFERTIADGSFVSWLAICNGKIIATSGISFSQRPPYYSNISGYVGTLSCMYTLKEYRRKGIAKKLLGLVVNEAKKYGCGMVQITASNMGMLLYKDFGFEGNNNFMQYKIK